MLIKHAVEFCCRAHGVKLVRVTTGAGKTESAKKFLQYLAFAATQGGISGGLEEKVLATSPLMEAFGNAQTILNDNSSRYGKYLMLQFDLTGKIMGAVMKTYLLEKTRVVRQTDGERNYHIFHLLLDGASKCEHRQFRLPHLSSCAEMQARRSRCGPGCKCQAPMSVLICEAGASRPMPPHLLKSETMLGAQVFPA